MPWASHGLPRSRNTIMKILKYSPLALLFLLGFSVSIFADDPAAACGAAGCGIVVWLIMMIAMFAFFIGLIIFIFKWIKKDAISRGMPNAGSISWLALLGLLGLLIYVLQRPQGNMFSCPHCGKQRMQGLTHCPHCGQP